MTLFLKEKHILLPRVCNDPCVKCMQMEKTSLMR